MDFKRIYEADSSLTFYDLLQDQTSLFYIFIKEEGGKYSDSYTVDMYRRHYGFTMPDGAKYFSHSSGYLKQFKMRDIEITSLGKDKYGDVLSLPVKVLNADKKAYVIETVNEDQTDKVEKVLKEVAPFTYDDEHALTVDRIQSLYKYGKLDDVIYESKRYGESVFKGLIPFIEKLEFCPRGLLQLVEAIKGFNWPTPEKVSIAYFSLDWGNPASIKLALIDSSIDKRSTNEDEYLKELQDHFGETKAEFKKYYNSYTQNCPDPFGWNWDHNAKMVIRFEIKLPEEKR